MKTCHKCGTEWTRREQPGFKEVCPGCTSYLHACVNCKLYNPSADRCSSITAECTGDRAGLNYCEEYQFRDTPRSANHRNGNGRTPRDVDLGGPGNDGGKKVSGGARQKFNQLFGE